MHVAEPDGPEQIGQNQDLYAMRGTFRRSVSGLSDA